MVQENDLDAAIRYEYARSSEWVINAFTDWKAKHLQLPKGSAFRRLGQMTVGDVLQKLSQGEELPVEVDAAVTQTLPEDERILDVILSLLEISPLFPTPFLRLPPRGPERRVSLCTPVDPLLIHEEGAPLTPLQRFDASVAYLEDGSLGSGWRQFRVLIDLRESKVRLKEKVCAWIDAIDDGEIQKCPAPTGKAAAKPWHHLRELAAYRLSAAGWGHERASRLLDSQKEQRPQGGRNRATVFPDYSAGGWHNALKSAESRIQELFPTP